MKTFRLILILAAMVAMAISSRAFETGSDQTVNGFACDTPAVHLAAFIP